jgi:hypothetical protein
VLLLLLSGGTAPARADEPAAPDTSIGRFLESLSDSTDAHFGAVAEPADTAGLDSARAYAFTHPELRRDLRARKLSLFPVLDFNRVDGPALGVGAVVGAPTRWGELKGEWAEATGPNLSLGSVRYLRRLEQPSARWELTLFGGRSTPVMDREDQGHRLSAIAGFVSGGDRSHFLRQDGVTARLSREGLTHRLAASYRDELESPRTTTATWNLRRRTPVVIDNLPAALGRARELSYELLWRVPHSPVIAQLLHATSSRSIGSDFEYRRTLASAGAEIGFGRTLALVSQAEYGALNGDFLPQDAFYLGGPHTLRSVPYAGTGGSRIALARLELILVRDVFEWSHIPSPSAFPIQLAAFAASGAAWGPDPYTGRARPGVDWPNAADWRNEAGFSVMYQPGIPDPAMFVRFNWAYPIGPGVGGSRLSVSLERGLDLVKRFERE